MPSLPPGADAEIGAAVWTALQAADDKLGRRPEAFYVGEVLGITDWYVVTSGGNPRQVRAIVENIEEWLTIEYDLKPRRVEGLDRGAGAVTDDAVTWVLMDYGVFIVHVFDHRGREFYELDRLWRDVPRIALDHGQPTP